MSIPVKIKRSGTTTSTPSSLDHGELAINYADATLFWKDATNTIRSFVFQTYASATHKSQHATGGSDALTPADIGAAPAASPTFTGVVAVAAGSVSLPSLVGTDNDTGMWFPAANTIAWSTNGKEAFRVDSVQRVRIAETTTDGTGVTRLEWMNHNGTSGGYSIRYGDSYASGIVFSAGASAFVVGNSGGQFAIGTSTAHAVRIGTNGSTRILVESGGNVGIGTTSPSSLLHVNGVITVAAGTAAAPAIVFSGDANTGVAQLGGADSWSVVTAAAERLRVDAGGRVGIGHATPADFNQVVNTPHLVVGNGTNTPGVTLYSGTGNAGSIAFADGTAATDQYRGLISYNHALEAMRFFVASSERVRIDSSGRVAIGTTYTSNGQLTVAEGQNTRLCIDTGSNVADSALGVDFIDRHSATGQGAEGQVGGFLRCIRNGSNAEFSVAIGTTSSTTDDATEKMRVKSTGAIRFVPLSADPASGEAGDVYYNSSTNELQYHNGSAFVGAAPAASPQFSGNVGIGTSPTSFSSSFNQLVVGTGAANQGATIYSTTQGTLAFGDTATTGADGYRGYIAYVHTTDYMVFGTGGAERLRANAGGITVSGVITVSATSGSAGSYAPSLTISGDSNTGFGQVSGQSDSASVFTAGHERVRVDSSGRVGIGATPSYAIDVAYNDSYQMRLKRAGTGQGGLRIEDSAGNFHNLASASNVFVITSGATERVRLDASGRWGIGTTSPSALLDINSDTMRLRTARTPASATAAGNAGDICWDADYVYICVSSNSWKRASLASW